MKTADHSDATPMPFVISAPSGISERRKAHLNAYLLFGIGAGAAWMRAGYAAEPQSAVCLLAVVWFPALIVEAFRRFGISNYGFAAALLSGICGYDGISRLLHSGYGIGC